MRRPLLTAAILFVLGLLTFGSSLVPATGQGRPDLVWQRGGAYAYGYDLTYSHDSALLAQTEGSDYPYRNLIRIYRVADKTLLRTIWMPNRNSTSWIVPYSISFSPDMKQLAVGCSDNSIRIYGVSNGVLLQTLTGFSNIVFAVKFSPDGRWLAGGSYDSTVRIFEMPAGVLIRTLIGHDREIFTVDFSPNGQLFASGSQHEQIIVRSTSTWQILYTIPVGSYNLQFSPDSQTIVSTPGGRCGLYRAADGLLLREFGTAGSRISISPDNQFVVTSESNGCIVYRISDGQQVLAWNTGSGVIPIYSPDGRFITTSDSTRTVNFWGASNGIFDHTLTPNPTGIGSLNISKDGSTVVTVTHREDDFGLFRWGRVNFWRPTDGIVLQTLDTNISISDAILSPDKQILAVGEVYSRTDGYLNRVKLYQAPNWIPIGNLPGFGQMHRLAFSSDGRLFASSDTGGVRLWSFPDFTDCNLQDASFNVDRVVFSPDGTLLVGASGGTLIFWNTATCQRVRTINMPDYPYDVAFTPDGQYIYGGGDSKNLHFYRVSDGTLAFNISNGDETIRAIALSPDGQTVAIGSDNKIQIYLVQDGSRLVTYDQEATCSRIAYTPDGKYILYGRWDGPFAAILNPYRNAIIPAKGGNTGNVTVKIITPDTFTVVEGTTVQLTHAILPAITPNITRVTNPHVLTATFALNGAELGERNVVITLPGGETRTYPQGFTIEQTAPPSVWSDTLGRSVMRPGRNNTLTLLVGNRGNTDINMLPLWISGFPLNSSIMPLFDLGVPPIIPGHMAVDPASIPISVIDGNGRTVPLMFGPIAAGNGGPMLPFRVIPDPTSAGPHNLHISISPPSECPKLVSCLGHLATGLLARLLPGNEAAEVASCFIELVTAYCEALQHDTWKKPASMTFMVVGPLVSCAAPFLPPVAIIDQGLQALQLAYYDEECSEVFAHLLESYFPYVVLTSADPNEITGSHGNGQARWIANEVPIAYTIFFENLPTAQAPAQEIVIKDRLDATLFDMTTISLQSITFADHTVTPTAEFSPPVGARQFNAYVDLRPDKNLIVHINANVDMLTGELKWHLTALDPLTMQITDEPLLGLLDPGQEGNVLFSVQPKSTIPTGTEIRNKATIIFDANAPMDTVPDWFNTIDSDKPVSRAKASIRGNFARVKVTWAASDVGSGVRDGSIYVSDNGAPYTLWLADTTETELEFLGESGHTYTFKSRARDNVFNLEDEHSKADATVRVQANSTVSGAITLQGCQNSAQTVTLEFRPINGGNNLTRTVTLGSSGAFQVTVPAKRYHLAVKGSKWLRNVAEIDARLPVSDVAVSLLTGDANNDNAVDYLDLSLLLGAYNSQNGDARWNSAADFTCDGAVDFRDLSLLIQNYNVQGMP